MEMMRPTYDTTIKNTACAHFWWNIEKQKNVKPIDLVRKIFFIKGADNSICFGPNFHRESWDLVIWL
jgi:hypothetical protein